MARQRRGGWQADLRLPDGKRLRRQFDTRAQAQAWEAATRAATEAGKPIPSTKTGRLGQRDLTTWGGLFEYTKKYVWYAKARAPENLVRNGRIVRDWFGPNTLVEDCTKADLSEFAADLDAGGNSGATINRKLAAASRMLREAHENGVIAGRPPIPRRPEGAGNLRFLTLDEEEAMLHYWWQTSDAVNGNLSVFLLDTGARAFSEACQVRWDDISERGVTFMGKDQRGTKNNTFRTVQLSNRARAACEGMKVVDPFNPGGPWYGLTSAKIRSRWDRMRTNTGLHDVTPHVLRHTCASRFATQGVELLRISRWLGHKSVVMTQRYTHLMPAAFDGMVDMMNERYRDGDQNGDQVVSGDQPPPVVPRG